MDLTLLYMQVVMKVTYVSWEVKELDDLNNGKGSLTKDNCLRRMPSLLDYMGYSLGYIGVTGPATNFKDYIDFIDQEVRLNIAL